MPHQMRIYQLIKQYRGHQLLTWQRSIGRGNVSHLATCAIKTTSPASSSPPPFSVAAPPPLSSKLPSSDAPRVIPLSLKEPLMGSSFTPPRCTPPLESQIGPSIPFPPGSSPSYTPRHLTTAFSSSTVTERGTGGWAANSPDTICSRSKSPESETTSIDGRWSWKCFRPVETAANSVSNRLEQGSDFKRWKDLRTPAMDIEQRRSRFSPFPEVILIDPPLTPGAGGRDGAEGGPHASRRVMTPASASRTSRARRAV